MDGDVSRGRARATRRCVAAGVAGTWETLASMSRLLFRRGHRYLGFAAKALEHVPSATRQDIVGDATPRALRIVRIDGCMPAHEVRAARIGDEGMQDKP